MQKRRQGSTKRVLEHGAAPTEMESDSEEDFDMLNVEFEWFDPQPEYDFHGIRTLLQQLFDVDAQQFDLSALTDLILAQPLLGSTVKVDGNETDAYAFLSVLNLQEHKDKPSVSQLIQYIMSKAKSTPSLSRLVEILSERTIPSVGLILTERLINVPAEVVPPMYTMLLEEVQWALEEKEPFDFSHYLILSKTYIEVASRLDEERVRPKKKKRFENTVESFFFHPEDEVFHKYAVCQGGFGYTNEQDEGHSDSKRAFQELGIKPQGHMILIEGSRFQLAVQDLAEQLKSPS